MHIGIWHWLVAAIVGIIALGAAIYTGIDYPIKNG